VINSHIFFNESGIDASMIFLDDIKLFHDGIFMMNPRIISRSRELDMKVWTEECLVLPPTFRATLLRDAIVTVEYQSFDGCFHQITLNGELARAFQHELDHDRGVLIVDHIGLEEMDPLMRSIEDVDHDKRMETAFTRFISDSVITSQSCFRSN
jgi:peptide deformylase